MFRDQPWGFFLLRRNVRQHTYSDGSRALKSPVVDGLSLSARDRRLLLLLLLLGDKDVFSSLRRLYAMTRPSCARLENRRRCTRDRTVCMRTEKKQKNKKYPQEVLVGRTGVSHDTHYVPSRRTGRVFFHIFEKINKKERRNTRHSFLSFCHTRVDRIRRFRAEVCVHSGYTFTTAASP